MDEEQLTEAEIAEWLEGSTAETGDRMSGPDDARPHPDGE